MKTDKPFRKSFLYSTVLFAVLVSAAAFMNPKGLASAVVVAFAICLAIALAAGAWCQLSKVSWSGTRFVATVMGFFLAYVFISSLLRKIVASLTQGQ